jgi:putative transposase
MPRRARILLPHTPHHVVQRGHNRASVFAEACDYRYYLDTLIEWKLALRMKVYA